MWRKALRADGQLAAGIAAAKEGLALLPETIASTINRRQLARTS
jgi:hypothetical protein